MMHLIKKVIDEKGVQMSNLDQNYTTEFALAAGEIFSEPNSDASLNVAPETIKYSQLETGF